MHALSRCFTVVMFNSQHMCGVWVLVAVQEWQATDSKTCTSITNKKRKRAGLDCFLAGRFPCFSCRKVGSEMILDNLAFKKGVCVFPYGTVNLIPMFAGPLLFETRGF